MLPRKSCLLDLVCIFYFVSFMTGADILSFLFLTGMPRFQNRWRYHRSRMSVFLSCLGCKTIYAYNNDKPPLRPPTLNVAVQ